MTSTAPEAQSRPEQPEETSPGTDGQEATSETPEGAESFSREYVTQLREEAKEAREKAKRADWLETEVRSLAITAATLTILADPADLTWSDEFTGEDGLPDQALISEAAEGLVKAKPWLGRVRGDVGQGQHTEQEEPFSLMELLRP